ncbi:hypothetical protein BGZ76_004592, partial [Entomortierella beljakovae]
DIDSVIKKVSARVFASDSTIAVFLKEYVKGERKLPTTTEGIIGLPKLWRRGKKSATDSRPTFLFLDLPTAPTDNSIASQYQSNVILKALDDDGPQDVPVFGVSGCGKTRSVIEVLCLQWGFYLNASDKDLGSDDLSHMTNSIMEKTKQELGRGTNTTFARSMTKIIFLSRIMILQFCLSIPGCQETFNSQSWAILQICPHIFNDVFIEVFKILASKLQDYTSAEYDLTLIVQKRLHSLREQLVALNYPNFSHRTPLRLVIDEAQIIGDQGNNQFESLYSEKELRPMLSPVLHGFRRVGSREELSIIYCGTGLSIRTLHWAMCSGDGVKEYGSSMLPIKNCLSDDISKQRIDISKQRIDMLIPSEAIKMLQDKLTGRFRPIVTAIEGIISTNELNKWEEIINNTEAMLSSWKDKERRGNLVGELLRVQSKMSNYPEMFTSYSSIEETLGLFLYRWYLLGETAFILEDEALLVEAALGRIKILAGEARVVMDEPLVLKAVQNYFNHKDPLFVAAAERVMLTSIESSVHGNLWETMMPAVFIETFKNHSISSWPLLPNNLGIPKELEGNTSVVGYKENQQLATTYNTMSTREFMEAHCKYNSTVDGELVPPFYLPCPQVSGPDLIFFIQIEGSDVITPVFVQLKLRQVLPQSDAEKALISTGATAVHNKISKESGIDDIKKVVKKHTRSNTGSSNDSRSSHLDDFCPSGHYISMVIAYPAEVVSFQVMRPDPEPEIPTNLKRVIINIDDSNFPKIFPQRHATFLDNLKKSKRKSEGDLRVDGWKKPALRKQHPKINNDIT